MSEMAVAAMVTVEAGEVLGLVGGMMGAVEAAAAVLEAVGQTGIAR